MPGGTVCSVAGCKRNSKYTKDENLKFFSFPKTPEICEEWVRKCNRKNSFSPKFKRICSRHFVPDDYQDWLKADLLKTTPKILKKTAVPSLYLSDSENQQELVLVSSEEDEPAENEIVEQSVEHDDDDDVSKQLAEQAQLFEKQKRLLQIGNDILRNKLEELQTENNILRKKLEGLGTENDTLRDKLNKNNNDFENRIAELEREIEQSNSSFEQRIKELFEDFVSPNQVDLALKKKSKVRWTNEELSKALTLWHLGKSSYVYLRETLNYPLPSITTLQRLSGDIDSDE